MAGDIIKMCDFHKTISKHHSKSTVVRESIEGSNMEEDPKVLSANSWRGQASIRVRDFPIRVFARQSSTPWNWQSQWVAADIWLGARSNRMDQHLSSFNQVQDGRD